jgi:hypothetical protein
MKDRLTPEEFVKLARELPRDERVPYAFEKRVMAHLGQMPAPDMLAMWTQALWKAVAPCVGIMLIALVISFARTDDSNGNDLQTELDNAVMAPPDAVIDLSA